MTPGVSNWSNLNSFSTPWSLLPWWQSCLSVTNTEGEGQKAKAPYLGCQQLSRSLAAGTTQGDTHM